METSKGTIELELDAAKAPISVANFVSYVKKGHYDGLIFHRIIPDFMAQGGGFTPDMQQKATDANIQNEAKNGLKNVKGTLAMARTPDPHSASSQFFINLKDNSFLDYPGQDGWGYCVFGKVSKGQEVVDAMAAVATGTHCATVLTTAKMSVTISIVMRIASTMLRRIDARLALAIMRASSARLARSAASLGVTGGFGSRAATPLVTAVSAVTFDPRSSIAELKRAVDFSSLNRSRRRSHIGISTAIHNTMIAM